MNKNTSKPLPALSIVSCAAGINFAFIIAAKRLQIRTGYRPIRRYHRRPPTVYRLATIPLNSHRKVRNNSF